MLRRMRLAGDDDLHGSLPIGEQPGQAFRIVQQQVRTFVGSETAREAQRQDIGLQGIARSVDVALDAGFRRHLPQQAATRVCDEIAPRFAAHLPDLQVRCLRDVLAHRVE